jgi:hypothetical protein
LKKTKNYHIKTAVTEPHSPWQNRAEAAISELKRHTSRLMRTHNSPKRLWDYCCILVARIRNLIPNNYHLANGRTPDEIVTGDTSDISEFLAFTWYQPVWYLDTASYPEEKKKIGRWLGVSHRVGQAMCFWVLTENANAISHTSVQAMSKDELNTDAIKSLLQTFDHTINDKIGDHLTNSQVNIPQKLNYHLKFQNHVGTKYR